MTSESKIDDMKDETSTPQQEARAKLREAFLRGMKDLYGKPCTILTYEKSVVQANFVGWNTDGTEVLVRDLKTPTSVVVPSALLRTTDILAIQFDGPVQ